MSSLFRRCSTALVLLLSCGVASAHPGHGDGLIAGFAHPFMGLDHLLAMFAVGAWAFQLGGRAKWMVPSTFVALMAVAAVLGMTGVVLPSVESGIAASVLLLGLLLTFSVRMANGLAAILVALFAVFHGYAHGVEAPASGATWLYALGFIASTLALHIAGIGFANGASKQQWLPRLAGALIAASGVWMMASA